jgi:hypothetical protein
MYSRTGNEAAQFNILEYFFEFSVQCVCSVQWSHTARIPSPLPLSVAKTGRNHLNEEFTSPPPPHWDRREILAKPHQLR